MPSAGRISVIKTTFSRTEPSLYDIQYKHPDTSTEKWLGKKPPPPLYVPSVDVDVPSNILNPHIYGIQLEHSDTSTETWLRCLSFCGVDSFFGKTTPYNSTTCVHWPRRYIKAFDTVRECVVSCHVNTTQTRENTRAVTPYTRRIVSLFFQTERHIDRTDVFRATLG